MPKGPSGLIGILYFFFFFSLYNCSVFQYTLATNSQILDTNQG